MPITRESGRTLNIKTVIAALKSLDGMQADVGWFPSARYESGTPVAYVMALNEYGHGKTPPRPFFRPAIRENQAKWNDLIRKAAKSVLNGKDTPQFAIEKVVIEAESDVRDAILAVHSPALSPITLELRAMKKRNPNLKVTAATVGEAARRIRQPGYTTPSVNDKPLIDTGLAIATLSSGLVGKETSHYGGA